jgi:hypothetical protein
VVRARARVSDGGAFPHQHNPETEIVNTKLMYLAGAVAAVLALAPLRALSQDEPAREEPPKASAPAKDHAARQPGESQQDRMRHCSQEAKEKELKGDERRTFMSGCLRTH